MAPTLLEALKIVARKVALAMRGPKKLLPYLSSEQEREGGCGRIEADLTKPDIVHTAVTRTGVKCAFINVAFGTPDHMNATIMALNHDY